MYNFVWKFVAELGTESRAWPRFGGSRLLSVRWISPGAKTADFLKWDAAQSAPKLAAMFNKNKSQAQPQQQQATPQAAAQAQPQQPRENHVEQVPPRYQPPPQPNSGILKNHFSNQSNNQVGPTAAALNHHPNLGVSTNILMYRFITRLFFIYDICLLFAAPTSANATFQRDAN